uniref:Uncharacterized protein n=1 Tax=Chromera velia CCMP2878 TaxID=1169474 RepID=A0A0G4HE40_9ALVE|eukprot:Cvel_966.t1-p1 / transcript=Cvel_966.t1 / gene=Cvel_966 / organism=Chromera_velia_CCMP2878 / gene_product=Homologous-pairing protein 2 homolog, putative / transcript_product=Homologous-pairing protein 2 homolog, putative / location=Cvel_scaffold31:68277-69474(+) / protein_length=222 / sequence_SO=supercontig / SO=protein_coding / is_pseudo=false
MEQPPPKKPRKAGPKVDDNEAAELILQYLTNQNRYGKFKVYMVKQVGSDHRLGKEACSSAFQQIDGLASCDLQGAASDLGAEERNEELKSASQQNSVLEVRIKELMDQLKDLKDQEGAFKNKLPIETIQRRIDSARAQIKGLQTQLLELKSQAKGGDMPTLEESVQIKEKFDLAWTLWKTAKRKVMDILRSLAIKAETSVTFLKEELDVETDSDWEIDFGPA